MWRVAGWVLIPTAALVAIAIWWQEKNPCVRYEEFQTVIVGKFAPHGMQTIKRCVRE